MSSHDHPSRAHTVGSPAGASAYPVAEGISHEHANEPFPRATVRDLIGENLREAQRRGVWQDWAIALGLAFLALGLPTTRLLGAGPELVQLTDHGTWFSMYLALQPIARLLQLLPWLGAERAWYLIAAACWAGSYVVMARTAMGLGIPRLVATLGAIVVLISPLVFLAGTLPGPSAPALLGSAILFRSLLGSRERSTDSRPATHPLAIWLAVCLLNPVLILLFPAVVWRLASGDRGRANSWPERLRGLAAGLAALMVLVALLAATSALGQASLELESLWAGFSKLLLGKGTPGAPDSLTWLLVLVPTIGVGVLGLVELLRRPAERNESAPPAWIIAFVGIPICVRLLGGSPSLDSGAWMLGPVLVLGLSSFLGRMLERWHWPAMVALLGVQLAFTAGFRWTMIRGDPNRTWTQIASKMLDPGDLVLTRDQQHDYLLHQRFNLRTINLRAPHDLDEADRADWWEDSKAIVRSQGRAGGRVLVDWKVSDPPSGSRTYAFQNELHELVLLAPVRHLDPRGEERDPPESLNVPGENESLWPEKIPSNVH